MKKQFRSKQFTRDVIDTLGNRIMEVKIPIPKAVQIREGISKNIKKIIENRIYCRTLISTLSKEI